MMVLKRALIGVAILLLSLCMVAAANKKNNRPTDQENKAMKEIGASNVKFSRDLYTVLAKTPGNIFFSPLSVHSILTLVSLGAKENTLGQIKQALYLPESNVTSQVGYRTLNKAFRSTVDADVTVKVANKVYATKKFVLKDSFKTASRDYFNSNAENVDFGNSEKVRSDINQWVEDNTNKKIKDLIPTGTLNSDTAMVLVNAVYFKGKWLTEFDPANSTDGEFKGSKGTEQVRFMETTSEFAFRYSRKLNAKTVELSYAGDKISMVILLPIEDNGFKKMEESLATSDPREYIPGQYENFNVHVKLPRFRLEETTPLNGPLTEMGISDLFASNADLSGLTSGGANVKVSKVLQKAFVEVNEEGSEAAATTVLVVQTLSLGSDDNRPIDFIVDQPFIFMIRHKASNSILFMGRYTSPSAGEGVEASRPVLQSQRSQQSRPAGSVNYNQGGAGRVRPVAQVTRGREGTRQIGTGPATPNNPAQSQSHIEFQNTQDLYNNHEQ